MKTLGLVPPSFGSLDSVGARNPGRRRTKSQWFPIWPAYPVGLIKGAKLFDSTVVDAKPEQVLDMAEDYDLIFIHSSEASLHLELKFAKLLKERKKDVLIVLGGQCATVMGRELIQNSCIDAVAIDEYDYTIQEISEKGDINVKGVLTKDGFTEPRERPQNLDALPWVSKVYKENLPIKKYYLPFVQRPYVSIFDSRGCLANCSFCLSPQTFTSHHADGSHFRVRYRSVDDTIAEIEWIKKNLRVREVFVDSDTFTDRTSITNGRLKDFCEKIRPLDIKWSCNVRGDASYETLKMLKDANCRLIVTGFESYNDAQLHAIQKGVTTKQYDSFAQNVRRADLKIQSCWIIGLPGETWETVENNMKFVLKTRPNNLQVAPAHALKGTSLYKWASDNGYIGLPLFNKRGQQLPQISQPQFSAEDTSKAIDMMYRRYFLSFGCLKTVLRDFITGGAGERERIIRDVKEFSKDSLQRLATQTLNNEISNR